MTTQAKQTYRGVYAFIAANPFRFPPRAFAGRKTSQIRKVAISMISHRDISC